VQESSDLLLLQASRLKRMRRLSFTGMTLVRSGVLRVTKNSSLKWVRIKVTTIGHSTPSWAHMTLALYEEAFKSSHVTAVTVMV
jgi:hypothetical protein